MAPKYAKDQPADFTNRIERVADVGSGGRIGKYITKSLLRTGKHTVTAITWPESANQLPEGVKIAQVNYSDESSLVDALKGPQFLVISLSVQASHDTQHKLIRATAKAGVPYIMPNHWGNDLKNDSLENSAPLSAASRAARELIKSEGSSWIALCCGFRYEFSLAGEPLQRSRRRRRTASRFAGFRSGRP